MRNRDLIDILFFNFEKKLKKLINLVSTDDELNELCSDTAVFFEETKKTLEKLLKEFDEFSQLTTEKFVEEPSIEQILMDIEPQILIKLLKESKMEELSMIRIIRAKMENCSVEEARNALLEKRNTVI